MKRYQEIVKKTALMAACAVMLLSSAVHSVPQEPFMAPDLNGNWAAHILVPESPKVVAWKVLVGSSLLASTIFPLINLYQMYKRNANGEQSIDPKTLYEDLTNKANLPAGEELTADQSETLHTILDQLQTEGSPNAVIIGETGTGKSTIIKTLARAIVKQENLVQDSLFKNARVWSINPHHIPSKWLGETSKNLASLLEAAKQHYKSSNESEHVILFFDEFHGIMKAGVTHENPQGGVAEMLKPYADGTVKGVHIIGATTTTEYQRYVTEDKAVERRFPPIALPEPSAEQVLDLLMKKIWKRQAEGQVFIPSSDHKAICNTCVQAMKTVKKAEPSKSNNAFQKLFQAFKRTSRHNLKEKSLRDDITYLEKNLDNQRHAQRQDATFYTWARSLIPFRQESTSTEEAKKKIKEVGHHLMNKAFPAWEPLEILGICDEKLVEKNKDKDNLTKALKIITDGVDDRAQRRHIRQAISDALQKKLDEKKKELSAILAKKPAYFSLVSKSTAIAKEIDRLERADRAGARRWTPPVKRIAWSLRNPLSWVKKGAHVVSSRYEQVMARYIKRLPIETAIEGLKKAADKNIQELSTLSPDGSAPILTKAFTEAYFCEQGSEYRTQGQQTKRRNSAPFTATAQTKANQFFPQSTIAAHSPCDVPRLGVGVGL